MCVLDHLRAQSKTHVYVLHPWLRSLSFLTLIWDGSALCPEQPSLIPGLLCTRADVASKGAFLLFKLVWTWRISVGQKKCYHPLVYQCVCLGGSVWRASLSAELHGLRGHIKSLCWEKTNEPYQQRYWLSYSTFTPLALSSEANHSVTVPQSPRKQIEVITASVFSLLVLHGKHELGKLSRTVFSAKSKVSFLLMRIWRLHWYHCNGCTAETLYPKIGGKYSTIQLD